MRAVDIEESTAMTARDIVMVLILDNEICSGEAGCEKAGRGEVDTRR